MDQHKKFGGSNGTSADNLRGLDSFTQGFVRKSAWQLTGKFGFKQQDRDEIEQRLYLKLARHLHAADPNDPKWKAFVAITVRRHLASMIRDNKAEKRDHRRVCSIHEHRSTDEGLVELAETISEREIPSHLGRAKRSPQELVELLLDVTECVAELSDEKQREICERLKHDSISQVARDMGIPRTTGNAWLGKLRTPFEERGLKDYL
jgi:RNA polymerase sigma-70 factor, ECF subfamily